MNEKDRSLTLKMFSYGLYVLTSKFEEKICASTVTWVSQCSFEPPMIITCLKKKSKTYDIVKNRKAFNLHILSDKQKDFASCFFSNLEINENKINGHEFVLDENNLPVFIDPISVLSCKVIAIVESPDHPVFISKINGVDLRKYSDPLELRDTGWSYGG